MSVTMREIARAVHKPESTIYRWRHDSPSLYQAVREYAERQTAKPGAPEKNTS